MLLYEVQVTDLSFSVAADAQLFGVYVPWPGTGEGIQHEPHHTQTLAGKGTEVHRYATHTLQSFTSNSELLLWLTSFLYCRLMNKVWSTPKRMVVLYFSWRFKRTTVTTLSTTSATASASARWCMAWFTSATYRYQIIWIKSHSMSICVIKTTEQYTIILFNNSFCCPGEADSHWYGNPNDSCSVSRPGPPRLQQHVRFTVLSVVMLTERVVQVPIDPTMFWHPLHNTVVNELWN